ncbi:MAG: glutathionylspermidine synthase family protein [Alphaproteobacteria bacterium]
MQRVPVAERTDWKQTAEEHGFEFHTMDGAVYWDESAYYRFSLKQIEEDLEGPAEEIEEMCFALVERAAADEEVLARLRIPEPFWDYVAKSWRHKEKNLYGRLDFSYDGNGPAKMLEYNADTPTSLYESAIFQWVWLEQAIDRGLIPEGCDQFNSIHEQLVGALSQFGIEGRLHLSGALGSAEDKGTVAYIEDCARQAGVETAVLDMEEIGIDPLGRFTDRDERIITTLFKLYPWEWMMAEEFGRHIPASGTHFIEPAWKALLSNKGLLPMLWAMAEGHPNLLPAYFEEDPKASELGGTYVRKPLLSREGHNVELFRDGRVEVGKAGPYGGAGQVVQAFHPLPDFDGNFPMVGCWLVASRAAGIGLREDRSLITGNDARFLPHVIRD